MFARLFLLFVYFWTCYNNTNTRGGVGWRNVSPAATGLKVLYTNIEYTYVYIIVSEIYF